MNDVAFMRMAFGGLILLFIFCGTLRYCNLWSQSGLSIDVICPARRIVVATYFSVVVLAACLPNPQAESSRLLARCFWILWIPSASSLALLRSFYGGNHHSKLRIAVVGGIPAIVLLALSLITVIGGSAAEPLISHVASIAVVIGALLTGYLIRVILWVGQMAFGDDDVVFPGGGVFPRRFAIGMSWLPLAVQCVAWAVFIADDTVANAGFAAWVALSGAAILIVILHPRTMPNTARPATKGTMAKTIEAATPHDGRNDCGKQRKLPLQLVDQIERRVRKVVEEDKLFLDPNLTKSTLVPLIGTNELYLHIVLKQRFGPFNKYVNTLRLNYSQHYIEAHPDAKHEEVAHECGFGSVRTYYRAKKLHSHTNE